MRNKIIPYNPALNELARKLRKNSTLSEVLLWKKIKSRSLGVEFHRQVPLDNYIVDFYCHELMLCIEIDGCSHDIDSVWKNDVVRQERLESLGVRFIRFRDGDVKREMNNVLMALANVVEELSKGE